MILLGLKHQIRLISLSSDSFNWASGGLKTCLNIKSIGNCWNISNFKIHWFFYKSSDEEDNILYVQKCTDVCVCVVEKRGKRGVGNIYQDSITLISFGKTTLQKLMKSKN